MLTKNDVQHAISLAVESGATAVSFYAFENTTEGWRPRPGCLAANYSPADAVLCAILLCFHFELYGSGKDVVVVPVDRGYVNSIADIVWPGAWYVYSAAQRLENRAAWDAIKVLLPCGDGQA